MNTNHLTYLLTELLEGKRTLNDIAAEISAQSMTAPLMGENGHIDVRIDSDRARRCGFPEVIFARGKTPEQVARIAAELLTQSEIVLATRATPEHVEAVRAQLGEGSGEHLESRENCASDEGSAFEIDYQELSGVLQVRRIAATVPSKPKGLIVVASAGTSDMPIAEEAALCAEAFGSRVERLYDIGVAGVHRALEHTELLREARVVIAVAGMEGALPSLIAGMVNVPVIAVPTSVGYGAHAGGLTPLFAMLTSCAGGIGVVNIDNGFGAAVLADRINNPAGGPSAERANCPAGGAIVDYTSSPAGGIIADHISNPANAVNLADETHVAHLDCSTGVSGDKFLGALLDIGEQTGRFTHADLTRIVSALIPDSEIVVGRTISHGISATTVKVAASSDEPHSRSFAQIKDMISQAGLPAEVAENATLIFTDIADVEAAIHNVKLEDVSFHEVGSLDSILDIVGVSYGLYALGIEKLYATPPAVGSGTVMTQHGELPVPAPATAALLRGIPTSDSDAKGELTTPTGAALLGFVDEFGPLPPMVATHIGHGAGTRDIGRPNVCQLTLGVSTDHLLSDEVVLLETNIDHISPELVGYAAEELLKAGALDVWVTPIVMKKSRPASTLSVLVPKREGQHFAELISRLTGTLGVRISLQPRFISGRDLEVLDTPWGEITIKTGAGRARAEHEDITRIARENALDYLEVLREVDRLITALG